MALQLSDSSDDDVPDAGLLECRICRMDGEEEELFFPCSCRGSLKYVHQSCLVTWTALKKRTACELCHVKYEFSTIYADSGPQSLSWIAFSRWAVEKILQSVPYGLQVLGTGLTWCLFLYLVAWVMKITSNFYVYEQPWSALELDLSWTGILADLQYGVFVSVTSHIFLLVGVFLLNTVEEGMGQDPAALGAVEMDQQLEAIDLAVLNANIAAEEALAAAEAAEAAAEQVQLDQSEEEEEEEEEEKDEYDSSDTDDYNPEVIDLDALLRNWPEEKKLGESKADETQVIPQETSDEAAEGKQSTTLTFHQETSENELSPDTEPLMELEHKAPDLDSDSDDESDNESDGELEAEVKHQQEQQQPVQLVQDAEMIANDAALAQQLANEGADGPLFLDDMPQFLVAWDVPLAYFVMMLAAWLAAVVVPMLASSIYFFTINMTPLEFSLRYLSFLFSGGEWVFQQVSLWSDTRFYNTAGLFHVETMLGTDTFFIPSLTGLHPVCLADLPDPFNVNELTSSALAISGSRVTELILYLHGLVKFDFWLSLAIGYLCIFVVLLKFEPRVLKVVKGVYLALKVVLLLVLELVVWPIIIGFFMRSTTRHMFAVSSSTLAVTSSLQELLSSELVSYGMRRRTAAMIVNTLYSPLMQVLAYWAIGICFVLTLTFFSRLLRVTVRKDVLSKYLRFPDDPDFHPVQELLNVPILRQFKRLLVFLLVEFAIVLLNIQVPTLVAMKLWPSVIPLRFRFSDPIEPTVDLFLFNFLLPVLVQKVNFRKLCEHSFGLWLDRATYMVGLRGYLLPLVVDPPTFALWTPTAPDDLVKVWLRVEGDGNVTLDLLLNTAYDPDEPVMQLHDDVEIEEEQDDGKTALDLFVEHKLAQQEHAAAVDPQLQAALEEEQYHREHCSNCQTERENIKHLPLRVFMLFVLYWITHVIATQLIFVLPLFTGRTLFHFLLPQYSHSIRDMYSYLLGVGVYSLTVYVVKVSTEFVQTTPSVASLFQQCVTVVICLFKGLYFTLTMVFLIPLMLGLLIDLSTIMPLQLTLTERPIFYLYQNLALGIALFKLGSDIVRSGYLGEAGRVWKVKFDRLQNQGMFRFNVAFFTLDIVLPLVSTLLLLICVPYLIVKLFVRYGDALVVVFTKWLATIPECTWTDTASYLGILGWHTVVLSGGAKECVIPYILSPFLETASLEESSATIWEQDPRMHRAILANTAFQYGFFIFAHLCLLAGVIFGIVLLCRSLEQAAIEDTFVKEKKLVNFQDAAAPQEQEGKEEKKTMETKAAIHVPPPGQPDAVVAH